MMFLNLFFKLKEHGSNVRTEFLAGLTTFLTMVYIIFVNPKILASAGMSETAVFTATCLVAAIGCFIMAFYANYPIAQAPGMGLNAFFTFTVVGELGYSWQEALAAVFISGCLFVCLSLFKFRAWLINAIPISLRYGISAGIGLFLINIALSNVGIVVADPNTLTTLGNLSDFRVLMFFVGISVISVCYYFEITGSILWGILVVAFLSFLFGDQSFLGVVSMPQSVTPTFLQLDFGRIFELGTVIVIFSFLFVDLFDTTGTMLAVTRKLWSNATETTPYNFDKALLSDSVATVSGSLLGSSPVTSYVESVSGISVGGRTGLTTFVVGLLFLVALFFEPLARSIPVYAIAPALFFVGMLMCSSLNQVNWDDVFEILPVLASMLGIVLFYSIADGIAFGFILYTLLNVCTFQIKKISLPVWVLTLIFVLYYGFLR